MPPPHHMHHHPPHHYMFPEPDEERLVRAVGKKFGRPAARLLAEHGSPPEQRILLEVVLTVAERLARIERELESRVASGASGHTSSTEPEAR